MPYIQQEERKYFDKLIYALHHHAISNAGELNYILTEVINQYHMNHSKCYATMNDIVGAFESCKAEYQRRVVGPYEDSKIASNGDVFGEEVTK